MNSTSTLSSADLALQDTGVLAAAEYDRLAVWAHSPLFSGLGAASTAAGRCISAGWCSTSTADSFSFVMVAFGLSRVSCVCTPPSFFPKTAESVHCFVGIVFRAVAKTRCTLLEYGQSKVKGRKESQTSTTEAE